MPPDPALWQEQLQWRNRGKRGLEPARRQNPSSKQSRAECGEQKHMEPGGAAWEGWRDSQPASCHCLGLSCGLQEAKAT